VELSPSNDFIRRDITAVLGEEYQVDLANDKAACVKRFRSVRYDITLLDLAVLGEATAADEPVNYARELRVFWEQFPAAEIIVLAKNSAVREAVRAVKAGAADYLTFPVAPAELRYALDSLREALQAEAELDYLRDEFWKSGAVELMRTRSQAMKEVVSQMQLVAPTRTTVLLTGETGTGKGVLAQIIHQHSNRESGPFVSVHCGAIPDTLVESELFGHEKGAFTGAEQRRLGKFEIAEGGTIFLDEIGTLTPAAQIKLLQVLQDRTLQRVGSDTRIELDARVIAATNVDLRELCERGDFRTDLFYRLNVFPIVVPPLHERREDVPALAESFRKRFNKLNGKQIRDIAPAVMTALQNYSWPGNVRELENLFERAFILEQSTVLTPESFPSEILGSDDLPPVRSVLDTSLTLAEVQQAALEDVKRQYLKAQLAACNGRIDRTAEAAGITTRHLHKLMKAYGLRKEDFRTGQRRKAEP